VTTDGAISFFFFLLFLFCGPFDIGTTHLTSKWTLRALSRSMPPEGH
jgi:hypothetical protein